jgi:hypothetical protein
MANQRTKVGSRRVQIYGEPMYEVGFRRMQIYGEPMYEVGFRRVRIHAHLFNISGL